MSDIPVLPPLRDVIRAHGLTARKALGQNFLLDMNLTRRIARAAGPLDGVTVLEVGPGPGGLSRSLLLEGARRVVVIEKDRRCIAALAEIERAFPGRLVIVEGDASEIDAQSLIDQPARVVANLPYNVATLLLANWLDCADWPPWWESLTLMFQREVAERLVAPPGSRQYGRLSVLAQWRSRPRILFHVDRRAFTPPPKVTSSVVQLTPAAMPEGIEPALLKRITAAAFGQRRKMLRSSLKSITDDVEALLAGAGIAATDRAEDVPVAGYLQLVRTCQRLDCG